MTTKKIVTIVGSVLLALGLLVALVIGGIFLFVFQQVGNSEAATVSRAYLKNNERLKQEIGEVKEFGWLITGNISVQNSSGTATLNLKVIGERKTVNATVDLIYRSGKEWRVTGAAYRDETGKAIELFNPYEAKMRNQRTDVGWQMAEVRISDLKSQISETKISSLRTQISNLKFQIANA